MLFETQQRDYINEDTHFSMMYHHVSYVYNGFSVATTSQVHLIVITKNFRGGVDGCSADIRHLLLKRKLQHRVHNSTLLKPILSKLNPAYTLTFYLFNENIMLSTMPYTKIPLGCVPTCATTHAM
jgi:hypothetical protein